MTARESSMSDSIKSIIGDLVRCCGEPYVAAPEVTELLYTQLCSYAGQLIRGLRSQRLSLENILLAVRNDPLRLARVMDYYRVLDSGYSKDDTLGNLGDDEETYLLMIMLKRISLKHLMDVSAQLKIQIADNDCELLPKHYAPFVEGGRLRLERIDRKISQLSIDEYLKFSKMRQSSCLLTLAKPSTRLAFWRWISEQCPDVGTPVNQPVKFSSSLSEELRVLVHVLTGDLLHVIDLTLYYRQKVGIVLSSPLTPVELKQAAHMKSVKFTATSPPINPSISIAFQPERLFVCDKDFHIDLSFTSLVHFRRLCLPASQTAWVTANENSIGTDDDRDTNWGTLCMLFTTKEL